MTTTTIIVKEDDAPLARTITTEVLNEDCSSSFQPQLVKDEAFYRVMSGGGLEACAAAILLQIPDAIISNSDTPLQFILGNGFQFVEE